jgi:single-strand DNA-binding protein
MNIVVLKGRLTKEPELRYSADGKPIATAIIAVKRGEKADFIKCVSFGKTAELITGFYQKGELVMIVGSIKTGSYENDGRKIYTTDVWINDISRIDKMESNDSPFKNEGEELPF